MTQFVDRHDILREVEFTESSIDGRVNLIMFVPKKQLKGDVWDLPLAAAKELRDNLDKLIGEQE